MSCVCVSEFGNVIRINCPMLLTLPQAHKKQGHRIIYTINEHMFAVR